MLYLYLALDDELAEKFAGLANNCLANLVSPAARDLMVTRLGALVHKPGQLPDELGARPIGIGNYDLRSFTATHVRDVTCAFLKVEEERGNGRLATARCRGSQWVSKSRHRSQPGPCTREVYQPERRYGRRLPVCRLCCHL